NLPLAEMQYRGRPVLAFSLGAHPEVVADPWLLCGSAAEMADKAIQLVREGLPPHLETGDCFNAFRARFQWRDVINRYTDIVERTAVETSHARNRQTRVIVVDCSCASRDPANPGVIRVVRRTCEVLQKETDLVLIFVQWDPRLRCYCFLNDTERQFL